VLFSDCHQKGWKESAVSDYYLEKRFGMIAVEMGFITAEQLHEAMMIQLEENFARMNHRLIGQILLENAYITSDQIREVLKAIGLPVLLCLFLQGKLAGIATDAG
jgi:hypothetical protein